VGGLLAAGMAMAGVPNSALSTQPGALLIKGDGSEPTVIMIYTIRDANNVAVGAGVTVVLDFSACYPQMKLCDAQGAGLVVNCVAKTVTGSTDGLGQVTFALAGMPVAGLVAPATANCATVVAGGQPFNSLLATASDVTLSGGAAGAGDLAELQCEILGINCPAAYNAKHDLDRNGSNGAGDLGFLVTAFVDGVGPTSCASLCP
jgi:hypothetical protein